MRCSRAPAAAAGWTWADAVADRGGPQDGMVRGIRPPRAAAAAGVFVLGVVAAAACGMPRRHVVDGFSMAPGLLSGDVVTSGWLPVRDRFAGPRRFERWIVTLPDGTPGIKRIAGLPGERVAIVSGDVEIDGKPCVKPPAILAETGMPVAGAAPPCVAPREWSWSAGEVLDEAPAELLERSRVLQPVRDVGLAAVVSVAAGPARVRVRAGPLAITWRLGIAGDHAVVVGRLDGHAVSAAWPLPRGAGWPGGPAARGCLPPGAPDRWDLVRPWPASAAAADELAPALGLVILHGDPATGVLRRIARWRDLVHQPAPDGRWCWRLGAQEVFLLGDFPAASRDSRHFGPVAAAALEHRCWPELVHSASPSSAPAAMRAPSADDSR